MATKETKELLSWWASGREPQHRQIIGAVQFPSRASKPPVTRAGHRRRRAVVGLAVALVVLVPVAYVVSQALRTLDVLNQVERERDEWQRPAAVLDALHVSNGSSVADVGSGAGYFALKIAGVVGPDGRVFAVDLRRLSLAFLWIRSVRDGRWNVEVIRGETDNPHLPAGVLDAVLIANTYHEFAEPDSMLDAARHSLKPGGRLVVLDRGPRALVPASPAVVRDHHDVPVTVAEARVGSRGFEILSLDTHFIDRPGEDDIWWLLVAVKP